MRICTWLCLCCAAVIAAADVSPQIAWEVECQKPAPFALSMVAGESPDWLPRYMIQSRALSLTNATRVAFLFRAAGSTNVPYELEGSVAVATNGKVRISWPASNVVAAGSYDYRILVAGVSQANMRGYGTLTVDAGFGVTTGSAPPYVQLLTSNMVASMITESWSRTITDEVARAHATEGSNTVHGGFMVTIWMKATNAWQMASAAFGWGDHATAGYATPAVTNGLATTGYVVTATADFVTASVTNGLATQDVTNGLAAALAPGTWRNPEWFQLTWEQSPTNAPDSTTFRTNLDQLIAREGFNNVRHDRVGQVSEQHSFFDLAFSVSPTNLANISSNGYLTHLQDGIVTAVVAAATFARTNLLVLRTEGGVIDRYSGGAAGSLRETVISNVMAHVSNAAVQIFSTYSPPSTFVRNTNLWIKPAPECLAAYNSMKGYYRGGVLVTPRHAIAAAHYPPDVGDVMYWVDATNGVFSSTVTASTAVASDVQLIRLSDDVPVRRAKFLRNPEVALPTGIQKLPLALGEVHFGTPEFQLVVGETFFWSTGQYAMMSWWSAAAQPVWRALYRHYPVSGDSGQPVMFTTGTDYVLLFCLRGPTDGPNLHSYLPLIEAAIASLGDTNTIEYLDVSTFTEF